MGERIDPTITKIKRFWI